MGAIPQGFESLSLRHFKQNLRLKRYVLSVFFVLFAQAISIFCRAEHGFSRSAQASLRNLGNPCAIRLFRHRKILRASFFRCFFDDFSAISACFLRFGIVPCTTGVVKGGQIYGFFHSTQRLGLVVPAQMGVCVGLSCSIDSDCLAARYRRTFSKRSLRAVIPFSSMCASADRNISIKEKPISKHASVSGSRS